MEFQSIGNRVRKGGTVHGHLHVLVWAWLADLATTATVRDTIDAYAVARHPVKRSQIHFTSMGCPLPYYDELQVWDIQESEEIHIVAYDPRWCPPYPDSDEDDGGV